LCVVGRCDFEPELFDDRQRAAYLRGGRLGELAGHNPAVAGHVLNKGLPNPIEAARISVFRRDDVAARMDSNNY
jgi:hypothetical protein